MNYRTATSGDIDRLIELRTTQLLDEGLGPATDIDAELRDYFTRQMDAGSLVVWLAEDKGDIVATGAVLFVDFRPTSRTRTAGKPM